MFKKILILMIIFSQVAFAGIRLNEIMANPICPDSICEWIELYNNGENSINMTGWKISDSNDRDDLENYLSGEEIIIPGKGFALIVDEDSRVFHNFDVGKNVIWIYVDDNAIGNGLNTTGEDIILYDKGLNVVDSIVYEEVSEGKSWGYITDYWNKTEPTPGKSNDEETKILDYSVVKINEFLPDPVGEDNANMPDGEWVELYNEGNENLDLLGFKFYDNEGSDADVIIIDTTTDGSSMIKKKGYLVVYMNGVSYFLNNNGFEKIKLYDLNNNLIDEVSYEGSKEGISWSKFNDIWQYSLSTPNSINKGNESVEDSSIKINKIYDETNKWGDIIGVKFGIYKADTNKNSIKVYVENEDNKKVSEEISTNIYGKFLNYDLRLPVKIFDNCDNKFNDGKYEVIVEGLDTKDSEEIKIEGRNCVINEQNKTTISKSEVIEEIKNEKTNECIKSETVIYAKNGVLYESKQDKVKRYALFFMTGMSILLLIYYIYKNGNQS